MKETILKIIEDNFADMSAHSYNGYTDDSERYLPLTVKELKWLYEELGGNADNLPII